MMNALSCGQPGVGVLGNFDGMLLAVDKDFVSLVAVLCAAALVILILALYSPIYEVRSMRISLFVGTYVVARRNPHRIKSLLANEFAHTRAAQLPHA